MPLPALRPPSNPVKRCKGFLTGTLCATVLFSTLILLNVAQTTSLVIKLFSQTAFRKANRWMANLWWGWCAIAGDKVNGTVVEFHGDPVPIQENAVVLLNHQEMTDVPVVFAFARAKKRLGDLKWFVKDVVKYIPGVGWGMLFLDCLFVKRNWTADRDYIQSTFDKILRNKIPIWLMIFAEGTRVTPEKLAESRAYAEKQGREPLQHVLFPRTKGFVATVKSLRGHVEAVYDVTIGYVDGIPTLWQWIKGYVPHVNLHVRRFPISTLPEESEALSQWLMDRFEIKDKLLDAYYQTGQFPPA